MVLLTSNNTFGICDTSIEGQDIINNISHNGAFVMYVRTGDMIYTILSETSSSPASTMTTTYYTTDTTTIDPDTTTPTTTWNNTTTIEPDVICDNCGRGFMNNARMECPWCGYIMRDDYTNSTTVTPIQDNNYDIPGLNEEFPTDVYTMMPGISIYTNNSDQSKELNRKLYNNAQEWRNNRILNNGESDTGQDEWTAIDALIIDNVIINEYDGYYSSGIYVYDDRIILKGQINGNYGEILTIFSDGSVTVKYNISPDTTTPIPDTTTSPATTMTTTNHTTGTTTSPATTMTTTNHTTGTTTSPASTTFIPDAVICDNCGNRYTQNHRCECPHCGHINKDYTDITTSPATTLTSTPVSVSIMVHYNGNEYVYNENEDYNEYGDLNIYNSNGENKFNLVLAYKLFDDYDYPDISCDGPIYNINMGRELDGMYGGCLLIYGKISLPVYGMIHIYLSGGCTTTMTTTDYSTDTTTQKNPDLIKKFTIFARVHDENGNIINNFNINNIIESYGANYRRVYNDNSVIVYEFDDISPTDTYSTAPVLNENYYFEEEDNIELYNIGNENICITSSYYDGRSRLIFWPGGITGDEAWIYVDIYIPRSTDTTISPATTLTITPIL